MQTSWGGHWTFHRMWTGDSSQSYLDLKWQGACSWHLGYGRFLFYLWRQIHFLGFPWSCLTLWTQPLQNPSAPAKVMLVSAEEKALVTWSIQPCLHSPETSNTLPSPLCKLHIPQCFAQASLWRSDTLLSTDCFWLLFAPTVHTHDLSPLFSNGLFFLALL